MVPYSVYKAKSCPPWSNTKLRNLKNAKSKAFKKYKCSKNSNDLAIYSRLRKEYAFLSRFCFSNYIHLTEIDLKQNPKKFWNFVNVKRRSTGFPTIMLHNNESSSDPEKIVDWFAESFQSIYNTTNIVTGNSYIGKNLIPFTDCCSLNCDLDEVAIALKELEPSSSRDFHGIFPVVLKHCSDTLNYPLQFLFNMSLTNGHFFGYMENILY